MYCTGLLFKRALPLIPDKLRQGQSAPGWCLVEPPAHSQLRLINRSSSSTQSYQMFCDLLQIVWSTIGKRNNDVCLFKHSNRPTWFVLPLAMRVMYVRLEWLEGREVELLCEGEMRAYPA